MLSLAERYWQEGFIRGFSKSFADKYVEYYVERYTNASAEDITKVRAFAIAEGERESVKAMEALFRNGFSLDDAIQKIDEESYEQE